MNKQNRAAHGGDWMGFETEYGKAPLDFSMNVNPFGMPEGVAKAIAGAAPLAFRYPDPECRRLRKALSEREKVPEEWILCGNGAADIIDRIALALRSQPGHALVTAPTFSEYGQALRRCGWSVDRWPLKAEEGFALKEDILRALDGPKKPDILFLCEPNNPTGVTTDRGLLERIIGACREAGTFLVIDECFHEFLDEPAEHTMKDFLAEHPNLILLRAFTKFYGMAGVRLGYCLCSSPEILEKLRQAGQPWNVSLLAEEAGLAALGEEGWAERTRQLIRQERAWLRQKLEELGARNVLGEANYLLFLWPGEGAEARPGEGAGDEGRESLADKLRRRGILIRSADNYEGLGRGWYRTAVRTREENRQLIAALEEIREDKQNG